jgi:regulator of sigma E protease
MEEGLRGSIVTWETVHDWLYSTVMTVLIFIVVLVVLILVHEFGHFVVAKLTGMRVDEFGIGYPPRLWGKKIGETEYTVNALPFGGFVRIYGEDATDPDVLGTAHAFAARPRLAQALTLVAGVAMNMLLAYVLITATLAMGTPRALSDEEIPLAQDVQLMVSDVLQGSPAQEAGLKIGDAITSTRDDAGTTFSGSDPGEFIHYIQDHGTDPLSLSIDRAGETIELSVTPETGVLSEDESRPALGVSVAQVGVVPEPLYRAPVDGAIFTWEITKETAKGLASFLASAVTFQADLSQVSGPVGIAGAVGNAYADGLAALLSIAAIISINLAIINLLPLPALDGGRLLFVIIEAIIRRPIKPSIAATVNGIGFSLLILLMLVVTGNDILKLIH